MKFILNLLLIGLLSSSFNLSSAYTQDVKEEENDDFFFGDDEDTKNEIAPIADGGLIYNIDTDDINLEENDPDPFFESVINLESQSGITEASGAKIETAAADIADSELISTAEPDKKSEVETVKETNAEIQKNEEVLFDDSDESESTADESAITSSSGTENTVSDQTRATNESIAEVPTITSTIAEDSDKLAEITAFRAKVDSMDAKSKSKALKSNKKKFLKEQKKTVKGYKKLTPDEILNLQEELASKEGAVERLESEMSNCKRENLSMKSEVTTLKAQLERALKDIEELKANPPIATVEAGSQNTAVTNEQKDETAASSGSSSNSSTAVKGIVFKVQLGAYQQFNLGQATIAGQKVEVDTINGWKKYTAGSFTNYKDANDFKKEVNNTGMNDAFIVAYKDGSRIDMKTAIESASGR